MNRNKMMPSVCFEANRIIAMRIESGDGDLGAAVKEATDRLVFMGMHEGMAAEVAQQVRERLEGDTELQRYQRLLATHDRTFGYSDDGRAFKAGATERARLNMMAAQLDPDRKVWDEYARAE